MHSCKDKSDRRRSLIKKMSKTLTRRIAKRECRRDQQEKAEALPFAEAGPWRRLGERREEGDGGGGRRIPGVVGRFGRFSRLAGAPLRVDRSSQGGTPIGKVVDGTVGRRSLLRRRRCLLRRWSGRRSARLGPRPRQTDTDRPYRTRHFSRSRSSEIVAIRRLPRTRAFFNLPPHRAALFSIARLDFEHASPPPPTSPYWKKNARSRRSTRPRSL